jgi:hypothetical protein
MAEEITALIGTQTEEWAGWLERNDTLRIDRSWDLGGVGTLRVSTLENVSGFTRQGKEIADRLADITSTEGGEGGEEAEPEVINDGDTARIRSETILRVPFSAAHALRFGKGTDLRFDALAGTLGTSALVGGIVLVLLAVVVALKLSLAVGIILGLLGGLVIALATLAKKGIELRSVAVEGDTRIRIVTELALDMTTGEATLRFLDPRPEGTLPKIVASGTIGGVAVNGATLTIPAGGVRSIMQIVPLPVINIPAGALFGEGSSDPGSGAAGRGAAQVGSRLLARAREEWSNAERSEAEGRAERSCDGVASDPERSEGVLRAIKA